MARDQRRLAAIVSADVAGYSRLMGQDEYTVAQLRAKHYSDHPEYQRIAEKYWYEGLRKAGFPEK